MLGPTTDAQDGDISRAIFCLHVQTHIVVACSSGCWGERKSIMLIPKHQHIDQYWGYESSSYLGSKLAKVSNQPASDPWAHPSLPQ